MEMKKQRNKFRTALVRPFIWSWNVIKKLAIGAYHRVKILGWFFGILSILLSAVIFYSPSIVAIVLYIVTGEWGYWVFAGGYFMWWFLPLFSPALVVYFFILGVVASLFSWTIAKKHRKQP